MTLTVAQIATLVNGHVTGDPDTVITGISEIQSAQAGDLTFLGNPKYTKYLTRTRAAAVIVPSNFNIAATAALILVDNPIIAFGSMLAYFRPAPDRPAPGIDPTAVIAPDVHLGEDVVIGPLVVIEPDVCIGKGVIIGAQVFIGRGVRIGNDSTLDPHVTLYPQTQIGNRVHIYSGTVVGSDGFGFIRQKETIVKIPQTGRVIIDDEVEIGANCAIDRGTLGDTHIGQGTKIDNLVQIAHNVKIGPYCILAGQSGVAGSSSLEGGITVAGQVGISGHLHIGANAIIAAQSGVSKDEAPGTVVSGYPAQPHNDARKEIANIRSIPELRQRIKSIEDKLGIK